MYSPLLSAPVIWGGCHVLMTGRASEAKLDLGTSPFSIIRSYHLELSPPAVCFGLGVLPWVQGRQTRNRLFILGIPG
jgi:hypothetical protein